ncbi:MAG: condensation domain-containing protein [Luteolibacter sp.]
MPLDAEVLAPLQIIMLRDSLAAERDGLHVEQLEIVFIDGHSGDQVAAAWDTTAARTEALQMAFVIEHGEPVAWRKTDVKHPLTLDRQVPASWEKWLTADRQLPLLVPNGLPWRVVYWPDERRFVWTFHHALLDGRSIARILHGFLNCLHDGQPPERLPATTWFPPDAQTTAKAEQVLGDEFAGLDQNETVPPPESRVSAKAVRCLGSDFATRLESYAAALQVSAPCILTWLWGQAVAHVSATKAAVVEQVRCGPPQAGKAGFSMNTLPLVIWRATPDPLESQLQKFRAHLLAMRGIEAIAPFDLPPKVNALANSPWSSVIMIERGTLNHIADPVNRVESITLHEFPGETLTAAAYLLPDLRLEVEGSENQRLLGAWVELLGLLLESPRTDRGGVAFLSALSKMPVACRPVSAQNPRA